MSKELKFKSFNPGCPHCGAPWWGRAKTSEMVDNKIIGDTMVSYITISKRYRCKMCKQYWEVVWKPHFQFSLKEVKKGLFGPIIDSTVLFEDFCK